MTVFAVTIIVSAVLFFRDEVRSLFCRKQLAEMKSEAEQAKLPDERTRANALLAQARRERAALRDRFEK